MHVGGLGTVQVMRKTSSKQQLSARHCFDSGHIDAQVHCVDDDAMSGLLAQVTAQTPLQQVWLRPQATPPQEQALFSQRAPDPHEMPQPPQLLMSESVNLQPTRGQQVCVALHGAPDGKQPQRPALHTWPGEQAIPQSPQLATSSWVSMQVEPQHLPPHCSGCAGQMPAELPASLPPRVLGQPADRTTKTASQNDRITRHTPGRAHARSRRHNRGSARRLALRPSRAPWPRCRSSAPTRARRRRACPRCWR